MRWLPIILALSCAAHAAPPALSPEVFAYTASDGEFGYSILLRADGTWRRTEHSGTVPPSGALAAKLVTRFRAAVDHAPFTTAPDPACKKPAVGFAVYRAGKREARATVPCGDTVDAETARLPGCLEMLISHGACP